MIISKIERPPKSILSGFQSLLKYDSITCAISDCMGRFNAMTSDMRPLFDGIRLVGTAVTVKLWPPIWPQLSRPLTSVRPVTSW